MTLQQADLQPSIEDALAAAGIGTWLISVDRCELQWSEPTRLLHEVGPDYLPTLENALSFYPPGAREMISRAIDEGMLTGEPWDLEVPLVTAKGRRLWTRVCARAVLRAGRPAFLTGTISDITAQRATLESNERLSFIMRQTRNAVLITREDGLVEWANDGFTRITGISGETMIGRHAWPMMEQREVRLAGTRSFQERLAEDRSFHMDLELRRCDRRELRLSVDVTPIVGMEGVGRSFIVLGIDVTERHRAEAEAKAEVERRLAAETLLRELQDALPTAVVAYDRDERVISFNSAWGLIFPAMAPAMKLGATMEEVVRYGMAHGQFADCGTTSGEQERWLRAYLAARRVTGPSQEVALADGRWVQLRERRSPSGHLVCTRSDITRLKQAEELAQRRAEEDPLTALGNRALLYRKLEGMVAGRRDGDRPVGCLLLIDLDHFKAVNDSMGHQAGDALLRTLSDRIRQLVRKEDTVARLGGDEFAVLLTDVADAAQVVRFITRLRHVLEQPLAWSNRTITPSLSIGAALFPADGSDANTLMHSADTALYQAKRKGRHCHSFFDKSIAAALRRKAYLAEALRRAIARDEIEIALQPQVTIANRRHAGFEALARWSDGTELVQPSEFIPVAEELGLIVDLGMKVLRRTLAAVGDLRRRGLDPGRVAVNVAAAQLLTDDFAAQVRDALHEHHVAPEQLEIELTETTLLDRSTERIVQVLRALDGMGVSIALDDFGTGYASLSHLTQFPVHRLKIDRRFVQGIAPGGAPSPIVRTVISLAHGLGMEAVAEGVESEVQLAYLKAFGCDFAQGYLVGLPMTLEEAASYLRRILPAVWDGQVPAGILRLPSQSATSPA